MVSIKTNAGSKSESANDESRLFTNQPFLKRQLILVCFNVVIVSGYRFPVHAVLNRKSIHFNVLTMQFSPRDP